ncbi:PilZ domain-containing protein [Roseococcus sp. SDR]|uniref:PilZ domain-containing protein n=1 Tax=Roseococcus sp. SDR TaxID=2835532 RepID=UPI001BCD0121|nr:PilZ domain-containing protein [Roseococcus sp. SDR]MBS7791707.1 PilZ domain-containing protein [Roseococcus sp. SDR]MBV1847021.1 PilZ domain-containing protein [Roseococcus sp. SDR]
MVWLACLPLLLSIGFTTKLLVILLAGPENGSAIASLILALTFAALAAQQFRLRLASRLAEPTRAAPAPATVPTAHQAASAPGERRRHQRLPADWMVEIAWSQAPRVAVQLHDLSRGGARLRHFAPEPIGRRGLLHSPGLSLPVPFTVVESQAQSGLHIRFDLEGMGLEALEAQLEAVLNTQESRKA